MSWLDFKSLVRDFLTVDSSRENIQTFIDQNIRQAVIDLQSYIDLYRFGHETVYGVDDLVIEGKASRGQLPDQAQIQDAFFVATGYSCIRQPLFPYPWDNRHDLSCGRLDRCRYAIALDPWGKEFLVYPKVQDRSQIELFWDGLKLDFTDSDTVPFDEQMAACVAEYVSAKVVRRVDNDLPAHESYIRSYAQLRSRLYLDARDRLRMKLTDASPMEGLAVGGLNQNCGCAPVPADDTIEFVAFGDFGMDNADELAVANLAKNFDPDFMLWLGDTNYLEGAPETIQANILKYFDGYVPGFVYPVWGNHDLGTAQDGQYGKPLLNLFPDVAGLNGGKLYYDFLRGNAHFFVINSGFSDPDSREPDGIAADSVQALWLQSKLAASTAPWKIVAFHRPPYTSASNYTPGSPVMRWPFAAWGADLVLCGHAHDYERVMVDGLTYLVAGTGGAVLTDFGALTAGSQFRHNAKHGLLRISVSKNRLQSVFYSVTKEIIDNFTLYK